MIELNKAELTEMYHNEYLSIREIAYFLEVSRAMIHEKMIKFGIPRRKANELKPSYNEKRPCEKCGEPISIFGRYKICRNCWDKENGRERYPNGCLVPLKNTPRPKRKFKICLNCQGKIASWNRSGYCSKCWNLPGMKKYVSNVFCKKCGKTITGHGKTGKCLKCSRDRKR